MKPAAFTFLLLLLLCACAPERDPAVSETPEAVDGNAALIRNPVATPVPEDTNRVARMEFDEAAYAFGEVRAGTTVSHDFTFTNTGKVPLLITDARSTCGCTVPSYPKEPVAPGETATIRVRFDTTNKQGRQRKPITLTANTYPSLTTIYVEGTVLTE